MTLFPSSTYAQHHFCRKLWISRLKSWLQALSPRRGLEPPVFCFMSHNTKLVRHNSIHVVSLNKKATTLYPNKLILPCWISEFMVKNVFPGLGLILQFFIACPLMCPIRDENGTNLSAPTLSKAAHLRDDWTSIVLGGGHKASGADYFGDGSRNDSYKVKPNPGACEIGVTNDDSDWIRPESLQNQGYPFVIGEK